MVTISCVNRLTVLSFMAGVLICHLLYNAWFTETPRIAVNNIYKTIPPRIAVTSENRSLMENGHNTSSTARHRDSTVQNKSPSPKDLTFRLYPVALGGNGNHLFNLAGGYGLARTNRRQLVLQPQFIHKLGKIFNTSYWDIQIEPIPKTTAFQHVRCAIFQPELERLKQQDFQLGDYIQSWRYFAPYSSDLRKRLVLRDDHVTAAQNFLRGLKLADQSTLVGIHVRRGDMINAISRQFGRLFPKSRYLQKAMTYFVKKYPRVHFIVCSDDMAWCKKNEYLQPGKLDTQTEYQIHFSPGDSSAWDFTLLAQCNHSIVTIGTFGWWASWMAGGEVVYFNRPYREGSGIAQDFKAEDYFWPTWVGMDDN